MPTSIIVATVVLLVIVAIGLGWAAFADRRRARRIERDLTSAPADGGSAGTRRLSRRPDPRGGPLPSDREWRE